jgi:hypothetical protein
MVLPYCRDSKQRQQWCHVEAERRDWEQMKWRNPVDAERRCEVQM